MNDRRSLLFPPRRPALGPLHRAAWVLAAVALAAAAAGCTGQGGSPPVQTAPPPKSLTDDQILTLADVSDSPSQVIEAFQPLADYLAAQLADFGIQQGKVVVAADLEGIADLLQSGEVDLYFDSPYPALTVYEDVGAYPLLRRWKEGVAEHHTKIVVLRDSGITDLDGLLGTVVAFDDPVSTSGFLLPKAHLAASGYEVREVPSAGDHVTTDEIGYVFAGDAANVLAWVLDGKTEGAALASGDSEALEDGIRSRLLILDETATVPRHIAAAGPKMDQALRDTLAELLLNLHTSPEGRAVLETFESTSRFDALPQGPEGTISALQEIFAPVH